MIPARQEIRARPRRGREHRSRGTHSGTPAHLNVQVSVPKDLFVLAKDGIREGRVEGIDQRLVLGSRQQRAVGFGADWAVRSFRERSGREGSWTYPTRC
jgi:hypothetical protein